MDKVEEVVKIGYKNYIPDSDLPVDRLEMSLVDFLNMYIIIENLVFYDGKEKPAIEFLEKYKPAFKAAKQVLELGKLL